MNARVLVVDDEEGIRFTFESFLRKAGHEVKTVADYHSALDAIASKCFDLVFVDVILGDHTGVEILGEIKQKGNDPNPAPKRINTGDYHESCNHQLYTFSISSEVRSSSQRQFDQRSAQEKI